MKKIKKTLEKEINIDENIEDLIKLLVDKIYVSKIDGNRKHIKLEIYFKIGGPITLEGNLSKTKTQEYIICNNIIKENNSQSLDNDLYHCSRNKQQT